MRSNRRVIVVCSSFVAPSSTSANTAVALLLLLLLMLLNNYLGQDKGCPLLYNTRIASLCNSDETRGWLRCDGRKCCLHLDMYKTSNLATSITLTQLIIAFVYSFESSRILKHPRLRKKEFLSKISTCSSS